MVVLALNSNFDQSCSETYRPSSPAYKSYQSSGSPGICLSCGWGAAEIRWVEYWDNTRLPRIMWIGVDAGILKDMKRWQHKLAVFSQTSLNYVTGVRAPKSKLPWPCAGYASLLQRWSTLSAPPGCSGYVTKVVRSFCGIFWVYDEMAYWKSLLLIVIFRAFLWPNSYTCSLLSQSNGRWW